MELKTEEVYFFDNSLAVEIKHPTMRVCGQYRVLAVDKFEVFFDGIYYSDNSYLFDLERNLRGSLGFSRMNRNFFEKCSKKIGEAPLSEKAKSILRIDLPIRVGRLKNLSWDDNCFREKDAYSRYFNEATLLKWGCREIEASQIFLEPITDRKMPKRAVKIEADNGLCFNVKELIWKASQIRNDVVNGPSEGIGLYRSGVKNGIPVYYIWGFYDLANILKDYEEQGVDIANG